jgi:glycosyltransferase involved in cell wall biosynthesis
MERGRAEFGAGMITPGQAMEDAAVPITVLMPVYNAERHLACAVDSVLAQTFSDFELLVINDGSTDGSREILAGYRDPRLRIVDTENQGVAAALRLGVELAGGEYLARMDADDESLPHRLAVQKGLLDRHPEAVLAHSWVDYIDADGRLKRTRLGNGRSSAVTKWLLLWQNVPFHPTVMLRSAALRTNGLNYRLEMNRAEDFDLWNRLAWFGEFLFIPQSLVRYRVHEASVTRGHPRQKQFEAYRRVVHENFARYGIALDHAVSADIAVISGGAKVNPISYRYDALRGVLHELLERLAQRFGAVQRVEAAELAAVQVEQLTRWARYMLGTSRGYTAWLLWCAARKRPGALVRPLFWVVFLCLLLPRTWVWRISERRAARANSDA